MGKEEIARNEQFLLFPLCFLLIIEYNRIIVSLIAAKLEEPIIGTVGKGLKLRKGSTVMQDVMQIA